MRLNRIYQAIDLDIHQTISLDHEATQHIAQVLRMNVGDPFIIFNGKGGEYSATIIDRTKNNVIIKTTGFHAIERESPLNLHLIQCISRGEKMDWVIQKAVELGVKQITLLISERCGIKLPPDRWNKKQEHWQKIILSACEQCGRNTIPKLHLGDSLGDSPLLGTAPFRFILDPRAGKKLSAIELIDREIILLIGPEGGFTENEMDLAKQNGFTSISLGQRILRTETAGLAAISALQTKFGDF